MGKPGERVDRVSKWLRTHAVDREPQMDEVKDLDDYFPDGPAPRKLEKIDVVAVTGPSMSYT